MPETTALSAELGAELVGFRDLEDLLDDSVIAQCREALKWRGVLLIRGAHFDDDAQLALSHIKGQQAWA